MSEHLPKQFEAISNLPPENESTHESLRNHHENHEQIQKSKEEIDHLQNAAEKLAVESSEYSLPKNEHASHAPRRTYLPPRDIREMTYQRLLIRARKHLNAPQRALSKVVHQPLVDNASELVGQTVARPSGFLGGGIIAFLGTTLYYILTKNYGYQYNYFIFLGLLLIGFAIGWSLEIFLRLSKHKT